MISFSAWLFDLVLAHASSSLFCKRTKVRLHNNVPKQHLYLFTASESGPVQTDTEIELLYWEPFDARQEATDTASQ